MILKDVVSHKETLYNNFSVDHFFDFKNYLNFLKNKVWGVCFGALERRYNDAFCKYSIYNTINALIRDMERNIVINSMNITQVVHYHNTVTINLPVIYM